MNKKNRAVKNEKLKQLVVLKVKSRVSFEK